MGFLELRETIGGASRLYRVHTDGTEVEILVAERTAYSWVGGGNINPAAGISDRVRLAWVILLEVMQLNCCADRLAYYFAADWLSDKPLRSTTFPIEAVRKWANAVRVGDDKSQAESLRPSGSVKVLPASFNLVIDATPEHTQGDVRGTARLLMLPWAFRVTVKFLDDKGRERSVSGSTASVMRVLRGYGYKCEAYTWDEQFKPGA